MMIKNNKGFTLIELMIVLAIAIVVMAGTYYAFDFQHRSYLTEEEITGMQQNLRAAMLTLERDIRWAGFDPTMNANVGFTAAAATGFTFNFLANSDGDDNDNDGISDETGEIETITYSFFDYDPPGPTEGPDGDVDDIGRVLPNRPPPFNIVEAVAENIEAVEYLYTFLADSDGIDNNGDGTVDESGEVDRQTAVAQPNNIRAIQVWILARTSRDNHDMPDLEDYNLLLPSRTAGPGGVPVPSPVSICMGGACNDNFRRRILTATIKCRNMP